MRKDFLLAAGRRDRSKTEQQLGMVQWLDEVIIKAGLAGFPPVFFLTPTRQRHDENVFAPWPAAQVAAHVVSAECRQAHVQNGDLRQEFVGERESLGAVMRGDGR